MKKREFLDLVEMVRLSKENALRTIVCSGDYVLDVSDNAIVIKDGNRTIALAEKKDGKWERQGLTNKEVELIEIAFTRKGREKMYGKTVILNGRKTVLSKDGVYFTSPRGKAEREDLRWRTASAVEVMLLYLRNRVEPPRFIFKGSE